MPLFPTPFSTATRALGQPSPLPPVNLGHCRPSPLTPHLPLSQLAASHLRFSCPSMIFIAPPSLRNALASHLLNLPLSSTSYSPPPPLPVPPPPRQPTSTSPPFVHNTGSQEADQGARRRRQVSVEGVTKEAAMWTLWRDLATRLRARTSFGSGLGYGPRRGRTPGSIVRSRSRRPEQPEQALKLELLSEQDMMGPPTGTRVRLCGPKHLLSCAEHERTGSRYAHAYAPDTRLDSWNSADPQGVPRESLRAITRWQACASGECA